MAIFWWLDHCHFLVYFSTTDGDFDSGDTHDKAANSGFMPNRVKYWVEMVRDISDDVPRQILTAVKHTRTTTELMEMIQE